MVIKNRKNKVIEICYLTNANYQNITHENNRIQYKKLKITLKIASLKYKYLY